MIDFLMIATRTGKRGTIEIYPKFIIKKSKDLMIRGSDFYAVWMEERGLWSTDEQDAAPDDRPCAGYLRGGAQAGL